MNLHRQLVFNKAQDNFVRFIMKMPFVRFYPDKGGWLLDPLTDRVLAGACDYESPNFIAYLINLIVFDVLENNDSRHNQRLCLQYGLITQKNE